ncbi:hypothetical protein V1515DRAFT_591284 [Lipomyces mesembrius]
MIVPLCLNASDPYRYHFTAPQNDTPFHSRVDCKSPDSYSVLPVSGGLFITSLFP